MDWYDVLYRLYDEADATAIRDAQRFLDVFPPVDSPVALEHWQAVSEDIETRKDAVREAFPKGETVAELAAHASREEAFTALDLYGKYDRAVNVLVLDVDETLRSAGRTDNEIPRPTLHYLTELVEADVPLVICTGQTLENVKGFLIQGLGSELVHSGDVSVVYESGTGVFTPTHGPDTKRLLYEDLDEEVRDLFYSVRTRALPEAPEHVRRGCHLQGNEFNVTLKPNFETGSRGAREVVDEALCHLLDLLGDVVDGATPAEARTFYARADPEIRGVLERAGTAPADGQVSETARATFERVDVAYYEGDAAEITSLELNKVEGVQNALEVLDVADPFALVVGDSKTDLRVMEWAEREGSGIAAAPKHASRDVLDHVIRTDELVFEEGDAAEVLRVAYALDLLAAVE